MSTADREPLYFDLLSAQDKEGYKALRDSLQDTKMRSMRNHKICDLRNAFIEIKKFCIQKNDDDWKRCVVAGICWLDDDSVGEVAVNLSQLVCLVKKCKSTINTTLRNSGFELTYSRGDRYEKLLSILKYFKGNTEELRKWSVRKYIGKKTTESEESNELVETSSFPDGTEFIFSQDYFDSSLLNINKRNRDTLILLHDPLPDINIHPKERENTEEMFEFSKTNVHNIDIQQEKNEIYNGYDVLNPINSKNLVQHPTVFDNSVIFDQEIEEQDCYEFRFQNEDIIDSGI